MVNYLIFELFIREGLSKSPPLINRKGVARTHDYMLEKYNYYYNYDLKVLSDNHFNVKGTSVI